MEDSRKMEYVLPVTEVMEVKSEGIVCATGDVPATVPGMGHGWDLDFDQ